MVKIERSKGVINTEFKIVALSREAGGTHAGPGLWARGWSLMLHVF